MTTVSLYVQYMNVKVSRISEVGVNSLEIATSEYTVHKFLGSDEAYCKDIHK
jgi:hypothetical protein